MSHRIALAALMIACLALPASAQKDKPKPMKLADVLTWETVAAEKASKLITKRAQVPGGWLVVVQNGDDMTLTFLPDADHRWDDKSPSDTNPPKPKFDDITKSAGLDKAKADLEQARAAALAERDKAEAALKRAEQELKKLRSELEKRGNKPTKGEKAIAADKAVDGGKEAIMERQRIAEALGLAARDESHKAKALADQARAAAVAEREKVEAVQKQLAETAAKLEEAITQRKKCEEARVAAELCLKVAEVARREALVQKDKAEAVAKDFQKEALVLKETLGAVAKEFQKQLADTTKALEITRASEKRNAAVAANAEAESQRLKAENDLLKKEAERLRQLLDKKKK